MFRPLLLCLFAALCCGHQDQDQDHDDWTDPTDMFNYDAAIGKMIKHKHKTVEKEKVEGFCEKAGEDSCPDTSKALVTDIEKPIPVTEGHKLKEDLNLAVGYSNPVFRRFLRKVLNEAERFGLPEDSSSEVYYNAEMVLTKQMVEEIQKFIDDEDWNLGALEEALVGTLVQFRHHSVKEWWARIFEDYIGIDVNTTFKILLCITCIVTIIATELWSLVGWFTQLKRLCVLSFFISVAWNWMYLYKVAFAERQADLAKKQEFDSGCIEKMSWSESLIEWWRGAATFRNDPCEEYFKALMINPVLMVPPSKALALTFTDFVTEPLKHLGKAMGEFLNGLLAEIPPFYQLLVLILIAAIILAFCYGASTTFGHALAYRNDRQPNFERLPPAEPSRERLLPAEPSRERLLPAEPSRERLLPAEPSRERLLPAEPSRERLPPAEPGWTRLPPAEPGWTRLPPAEPAWTRLPPAEPAWERLPPAEPLRFHYGNVIEGLRPQPYYIEPPYGPVYRYPPNQRPENLQAVDVPYDGSHRRPPGLTEMDSHSRHQDGAGERRKEEVAKQKPLGEQGGKTAKESSERKHERREEPKERPRQRENEPRVESSLTEMQKKEDPPEQKSTAYQRKADSIEETNNRTQQRKAESEHSKEQREEELVDQNADGERPRGEEPPHERSSGLQQRREASVEEISHGEPSWEEREAPDDKSLEQTEKLCMFTGRKEEVTEQKPLREQSAKTAEESSDRKQRREEPKERPDDPRQRENEPRVESSFTELQEKEPPEQKSTAHQRKADSIEETNNRTQQRKAESEHSKEQREEELVDQNAYGEHPRGEEPPHERSSGLQQRREASVEEISPGEPSWEEGGAPDDKSLEQTEKPCMFTERKEEVTEQKPLREQSGKTAEESSDRKQRRGEPKERPDGPRQRENEPIVESSFTEMQKKEPPEQKSTAYQRKADSIEETNNRTQQRNTESVHSKEQREEELVDQNTYGERPRGEEPPHERSSGLQQRREASVEEISPGEPSWGEGGAPDDKSLEQTGASKRTPSERKIPREEATEEIDEYEDEYEYEYEDEYDIYHVEEDDDEEEESEEESEEETVIRKEESEAVRALRERLRKRAQELGYTDLPSFQDDPQWPTLEDVPKDSNYNHPRIGNTSWCGCHNCKPMESRDESNCCVEEPALKPYFDQGLTCILEHDELKELRFDERNLELMVEFSGRGSAREIRKDRNRVIRKAAYRAYSCFAHGISGPAKGKPIPSCVVDYIRGVFPDPEGAPVSFFAPHDYPAADMAADV